MRRLAAKRQREAPPERCGKLLTNVGPAVAKAARPPSAGRARTLIPGSGPAAALGPGIPAVHGPARSTPKHPSSPQFPRGPHSHGRDAGLGWAGLSRGAGGTRERRGRAPHASPAVLAAGPAQTRIYPPRHSPGAACAGCAEPGVPSPGPAPLCQHSGHPESLPALQPRAPSCGDTRELHPGLLEPDTTPRKGSLGSGDTRARLGLAAEGNAPISRGVLPWLSHGSQAPEGFFFALMPHRFCPPRAELHHLQGFVAVQGDTQIPDWRSTPLPEKLGKTPPAGPVSQTLIPSPHPGKSHPHTAGCKCPCAMSLPVLQV